VSECIFCQIARGEAPRFEVCEDELTLAFMDIFPVAEGHTLVVTKEHFASLFEVSTDALTAVASTSLRVAGAIRRALSPDGLGVFQLNGAAAGQTVFHYHMHLIPRRAGEDLRIHGRERADDTRLARVAERLRAALE
jgi:histidine triad (HIT) family protein